MTTPIEFVEFPKIARLHREIVVTEKIDGTNASVWIDEEGGVRAASRNRFVTPEADNYGFARWVEEHKESLRLLGPGSHFGEWWGAGIQRRYGVPEKRFSLFNVARWKDAASRPAICGVVPVLYRGLFESGSINAALASLEETGSVAAPGFREPEGIVIYHTASRTLFKRTLDGDGHKGSR